ncbi:hypothetical protein EDD22DRAFT_920469 [Suillus occidentalis]|nr:hypothetical protein EDD22DRAFT_920469 [Suillus occidentalis]
MVLFYFSLSTLFSSMFLLTSMADLIWRAATHRRRSYQPALLAPPVGHPALGRDVCLRQRSWLAILAPLETKGRMAELRWVAAVTPAKTNIRYKQLTMHKLQGTPST